MNFLRKSPRSSSFCAQAVAFLAFACSVSLFVFMMSCSSNNSSSTPPPPPQAVTVTVSSSSSSVLLGSTLQFTAAVTGSSNTSISWSVNGVAGGNSNVGTISNSGLYTAPGDLPNPATVSVMATSQADTSKSGSATVTVTSDISVSLVTSPPGATSVQTGAMLTLTATISSAGHPDTTVTWAVNGVPSGNTAVGMITTTGADTATYTPPVTPPVPPQVVIQAVSVADSRQSVSAGFVVFKLLESASQLVSASQGGTITLPSGSGVLIPAGFLSTDQMVQLSLLSSFTTELPSGFLEGVGPALMLTFSAPVNATLLTRSQRNTIAQSSSPSIGSLQFVINFGTNTVTNLPGSASAVDVVDLTAGDTFIGVPGSSTDTNATISVAPGLVQNTQTVLVGQINVKPAVELAPLPTPGAKIWNGTQWVDGTPNFDPTKKTLVLVHGMNSQVEQAFGDPNCVNQIMKLGGYEQVLGFDYDYTQGLQTSGQQLATFLNSLKAAGLTQVDIEAHSEGVPVSLSAACQTGIPVGNLVMLGGPINGTPAASLAVALQSSSYNALQTVLHYLGTSFAQPTGNLQGILSGPWATDMLPNSSTLQSIQGCVASQMANPSANLSSTKLIAVAGNNYAMDPELKTPGRVFNGLGLFGTDPSDGVVGQSSALGQGSGLAGSIQRLSPFPLGHTQLECDPTVISCIGVIVRGNSGGGGSSFRLVVATSGTGTGMVTANPPGPTYPPGTSVSLMATPDSDSTFDRWSGDCSGTGMCSLTMDSDKSVTATFNKNGFTLTVTLAGNGTGTVTSVPAGIDCGSACSADFPSGSTVTLTAMALTGQFIGWSGPCNGMGTCAITMNADTSISANFSQIAIITIDTFVQPLSACFDPSTGISVVIPQQLVAGGGAPGANGYAWTLAQGSSFAVGTTVDSATGAFHGIGATVSPGTYNFQMTVSDGILTGLGTFTLIVENFLDPLNCGAQEQSLLQPSAPSAAWIGLATAGSPFGSDLEAFGGTPPYVCTIASGSLPPGLLINKNSCVVTGTVSAGNSGKNFSFTISVADSTGAVAACFNGVCPTYPISVF
jgi:hypothetical protein